MLPAPLLACRTDRADKMDGTDGMSGPVLDRIGIQLYTVRSLMARNVEETLAAIAAIGYREVEFAGYFDRDPAALRTVLDRHGLAAPAAHIGLEALQSEPNRWFDAAEALGHRYIVVAWLAPADRAPAAAMSRTADAFNRIGEAAAARGLRFAYHNHDFEFADVGGGPAYDLLLARCDPRYVAFEMDLFWITKAGRDPLEYFERHPGRFPLVHVKDMASGGRMVDVGEGHIDWRRIAARRQQGGIVHWFVEHDEPADPLGSARASYAYLRRLRA